MRRALACFLALFLTACDSTTPLAALRWVDTFPLTSSPDGTAWDIDVRGDTVWARDSYGAAEFTLAGGRVKGVKRVDVTPRSPQGTSHLAFNGSVVAVGHGQRVVLFDAATGAQRGSIDSLSTGVGQLVFDGTTLYAAMMEAGVRRFDVANPDAPGGFETLSPRHAQTLWLDGGRLYAAGNQGLTILDVVTPAELSHVRLPLQGALVLHAGRWLYGNTGEAGLAVVDVEEPRAPRVLNPGGSTKYTKGAVALRGGRAVVPTREGLTYEFDLSDPSAPRSLEAVTLVHGAMASNWDVAMAGRFLVLAHQTGFVVFGP